MKPRKPKKRKGYVKISWVKEQAWRAFSKMVRVRDALKTTGTTTHSKCVTCSARFPITAMNAGHFLPGRRNAILFDDRGCHCQCVACNNYLCGNPVPYYKFMLKEYGEEVIEELRKKNLEQKQFTKPELQEMKADFEGQIKEYEKRREW